LASSARNTHPSSIVDSTYEAASGTCRRTVRDDHCGCLGRPVRGRQVRAEHGQRVPADDRPLRDRRRALDRRPLVRRGPPRASHRRALPAPLLARLTRLRGVQPARVHGPCARASGERVADRGALAVDHGDRPLAPHARASRQPHIRVHGARALRCDARDQRRPSDDDLQRLDRLGRRTRPRRRDQLRHLRARLRERAQLLAAALHDADRVARLGHDRRRDRDRVRDRPRPDAVREPAHRRRPADRLPRDPRRCHRGAHVELGDQADRTAQRSTLREPDPGDDVRDRDRARLPAERDRNRWRRADDRCARREQPLRAPVSDRRYRRTCGRT
jgi:hypothetical protein